MIIHEEDFVTVNGMEGEFRVVEIDGEEAYVENVSDRGACMLTWVPLDVCERIDV